jgi:hypothetical protein
MRRRIFAHKNAISKNVHSITVARLRVFTQPRPIRDTGDLLSSCCGMSRRLGVATGPSPDTLNTACRAGIQRSAAVAPSRVVALWTGATGPGRSLQVLRRDNEKCIGEKALRLLPFSHRPRLLTNWLQMSNCPISCYRLLCLIEGDSS